MSAWNPGWESRLYGRGRHLNRYPFEIVVREVLSAYPDEASRSGVRLLELGCGAGNNLWFAAREGFEVAGIDGSSSAVAYAIERLAGDGLQADLRVGDFTALPWGDETFDMVIDRKSVTHVRPPLARASYLEAARVLRPGGRLVAEVYSAAHPEARRGRNTGTGWGDDFPEDSYFHDVGLTSFLDEPGLRGLLEPEFVLNRLEHVVVHDHERSPRPRTAFWQVSANRT